MTAPARGPLRVLQVMHSIGIGGLERGVATLVAHASPGVRHEILTFHRHDPEFPASPNIRFAEGTPVHFLPKPGGKSVRFLWRLARAIRRIAPDVVHARNWPGIDGVLAARLAGVRGVVVGEHGWGTDDPQGSNRFRRRVRRFVSRWVREYTCVSRDIAAWLTDHVGIRKPVTQIYNGVDTERYRPGGDRERVRAELGVGPSTTLVGTVGRLDPIKNFGALVRAVESLPGTEADVQLRIAGYGWEEASLKAACGPRSRLLGLRTDTPELHRAFDLFALPSVNEGISNTILEAMASGVPVVANRVGGNPELVQDGVTGTLLDPADGAALGGAILAYARDPARRAREGAAARRVAVERFSVARMVAAYEDVWKRVGGGGDRRARGPLDVAARAASA